jgi:hypothetical protein
MDCYRIYYGGSPIIRLAYLQLFRRLNEAVNPQIVYPLPQPFNIYWFWTQIFAQTNRRIALGYGTGIAPVATDDASENEHEHETFTMVQLTEVQDEHFEAGQPGPKDENEDDYTDTGMFCPPSYLPCAGEFIHP